MFGPKFNWRSTIIDKQILPVIISSINPWIIWNRPVIAATLTENAKKFDCSTISNGMYDLRVATNLAIQAGEQQQAPEIPKEYQEFAQLFNDKAADHFPPSREWDHVINLNQGSRHPSTVRCIL
jgi:hypothetical protein